MIFDVLFFSANVCEQIYQVQFNSDCGGGDCECRKGRGGGLLNIRITVW